MRPFCFVRSVLICALAASAFAAPRTTALQVRESIILPRGWVRHSTPSPDHTITLSIGLPQPNFPVLESHLWEVSDPDHPRYGQHLSKEEVEELVAPHPSSLDAVHEWLATHGLGENDIVRSPAKDWVTITIPVSLVEEMLDTKYHVYKHEDSGDYLVRTTSYSLPEHLHEHIEVVQPTTMFGRIRRESSTSIFVDESADSQADVAQRMITSGGITVDASCNTNITVTCLKEMYNATSYTPLKDGGNSIGITGYLEQYPNFQDLQSFYAQQVPQAVNTTFTVVSVNGGINPQNLSDAGAEANLDVQFAYGITFPTPGTFWTTAGSPPYIPDALTPNNTNEPYIDWLSYVLAQKQLPYAISTSYGDDEQTVPESYAKRVCADLAQLGARGISLMFSSGDYGVGDGNANATTQKCFTNDGKNQTRFIPLFPAACPYVTSVGGTQHYPEVAVSRFYSGGGFSNYFKRPPYQHAHVKGFLDKLPAGLYEGLYNPNGRGIPDVAAQGDFFRIWLSGKSVRIGGTSASSPTFAGFVALLNDARLRAGKRPLGFLNPLIYHKLYKVLNDITVGQNPGCGTPGFNATTGWDPVTGLGTPNFGLMKELLC
ncbi:subtilisin-like protein [Amanita muscaria]